MTSRTPAFRGLRTALRNIRWHDRKPSRWPPGKPYPERIPEPPARPARRPGGPRIAIVGAGLAGLAAAHHLVRAGLDPVIFEASRRCGGRILTRHDAVHPGLTTELGASFLNATDRDVLALVRAMDLELIDVHEAPGISHPDSFLMDRGSVPEADFIRELRPHLAGIEQDLPRLDDLEGERTRGRARELDETSLSGYLEALGMSRSLRGLLEGIFTAEYGLDASDQSALNLLDLFREDLVSSRVSQIREIYGEPGLERFSLAGGTERLTNSLAMSLADRIFYDHQMVSISHKSDDVRIRFERDGSGPRTVVADFAVLTVPFPVLREMDLDLAMTPRKRRTIQELGCGTNGKVVMGFTERLWFRQGLSGTVFTAPPHPMFWDDAPSGTRGGSLVAYHGGRRGSAIDDSITAPQPAMLAALEAVFPGISRVSTGRALSFGWASQPFARGSYACYRVGQWCALRGAEFAPVGRVFFAGEHCSLRSQGYMNGAAETARRAAARIVRITSGR